MFGFGLRMEWLRYAVIWLIHPNILNHVARMFKTLFSFAEPKKAKIAAFPERPLKRHPRLPRQELSPCSSVPILTDYSLEGGRNESRVNENSSCKNLIREFGPSRCSVRENWCVNLPQIFIPARVESIRLKTMGALQVDPSAI